VNPCGMDRAEAEAIYEAGREVCVEFMLDLAARVERLEDRLRRLEEQARRDSRTSSTPASQDPPRTRQQRRAQARAKAKEFLAKDRAKRKAGGQDGHRGAGRELADLRAQGSDHALEARVVECQVAVWRELAAAGHPIQPEI
jgi:Family of unknown function (DUF6444)